MALQPDRPGMTVEPLAIAPPRRFSRRTALVSTGLVTAAVAAGIPAFAEDAHASNLSSDALVYNAQTFGAHGDGNADDSAAIQRAIDAAAGGGIVWIPSGTYRVQRTLTISHDRVKFDGCGTILGDLSGGPILRLMNVSYCEVTGSLFFDGQWRSGIVAVQLIGVLLSTINVRADRVSNGIDMSATAPATQNTASNDVWLSVRNSFRAITFEGDGTRFASNNRIHRVDWWGVNNAVSVGLDFAAYADNNYVDRSYLCLNFAGSIGIVFNSKQPDTDLRVYENHCDTIIESDVANTVSIRGNRTWQGPGMWTTFVRLRSSGSHPPAIDVSENSDVKFVNSVAGNGGLIMGQNGSAAVWVSASDLCSIPHKELTMEGDSGCPIVALEQGAKSELSFSVVLPLDWHQCSMTLYWSWTTGGNTALTVQTLIRPLTDSLGGSAAMTTQTMPGAKPTGRLIQSVLSTSLPTARLMCGRVTRNASNSANGALAVIGIMFDRTL